ncbi:hypothetical protein PGT21_011689 [Puccinia graminis f. sp. tritici]|nr:hypothetical protein PGT21_011689 [Puccinia graminis f. sp. tritici]
MDTCAHLFSLSRRSFTSLSIFYKLLETCVSDVCSSSLNPPTSHLFLLTQVCNCQGRIGSCSLSIGHTPAEEASLVMSTISPEPTATENPAEQLTSLDSIEGIVQLVTLALRTEFKNSMEKALRGDFDLEQRLITEVSELEDKVTRLDEELQLGTSRLERAVYRSTSNRRRRLILQRRHLRRRRKL